VNCFQKIVSLIFWTTINRLFFQVCELWIAFKKLYLWYSEQLVRFNPKVCKCCELLSKNCIFDILNNCFLLLSLQKSVVNCFQKIVSLIFWTTIMSNSTNERRLWIAFKKLYLWYSEQLACVLWRCRARCELLSKNCIFDILNNPVPEDSTPEQVVNCFQKIVSLIFWTTLLPLGHARPKLWIAFKKLYLWYSEQLSKLAGSSRYVVNCFQKIVSLIFWTTSSLCKILASLLWIAFKKLYLWYSEQLITWFIII